MTHVPPPPQIPDFLVTDDEPTSPGEPPITREELAHFFEGIERRQKEREEALLERFRRVVDSMTEKILAAVNKLAEERKRDTERIGALEKR